MRYAVLLVMSAVALALVGAAALYLADYQPPPDCKLLRAKYDSIIDCYRKDTCSVTGITEHQIQYAERVLAEYCE